MRPSARAQQGSTLIVTLIMLVLLTLFAFATFNLSKSNMVLVSNQQFRGEAVESARSALEEVLSRNDFSQTPATPVRDPLTGLPTNVRIYDVNSDGNPDVTVTIGVAGSATNPPPCIKSFQILPVDPSDVTALGCASQAQQNFGIAGGATWGAQCADVIWEVTAVATDAKTEASTTMASGIRIREDANSTVNAANYCS